MLDSRDGPKGDIIRVMPSIFTRIIKGEIPSIKVHEDELTLAIMDINPIQPGQILVIPKKEVGVVWDLPDEDYVALMQTVKSAARKLQEIFADRAKVAMVVEGFEITDHAHVKVFPFSTEEEFHARPIGPVGQMVLQKQADRLRF